MCSAPGKRKPRNPQEGKQRRGQKQEQSLPSTVHPSQVGPPENGCQEEMATGQNNMPAVSEALHRKGSEKEGTPAQTTTKWPLGPRTTRCTDLRENSPHPVPCCPHGESRFLETDPYRSPPQIAQAPPAAKQDKEQAHPGTKDPARIREGWGAEGNLAENCWGAWMGGQSQGEPVSAPHLEERGKLLTNLQRCR